MIIPIKLKGKTKEIIRRSNVQIFSLDSIDHTTRNRFLFGRTKVLLILDQHTLKGRLHDLGNRELSIETDEEIPIYVKKGHIVLVVLPESHQRRYVIQARVKNRFLHRVEVEIMDPRSDRRFKLERESIGVQLRPISHAILQGILYEKVLIVREINFGINESHDHGVNVNLPAGALPTANSDDQGDAGQAGFTYVAKDILLDVATKRINPEFQRLTRSDSAINARLLDISRGGVGLSSRPLGHEIPRGSTHLISGTITLSQDKSFCFSLIGIVRGTNLVDDEMRLHIMYLKSLPRRFDEIMSSMLIKDKL